MNKLYTRETGVNLVVLGNVVAIQQQLSAMAQLPSNVDRDAIVIAIGPIATT
ncbi:MAG: hypothetical protein NT027_01035 [Proteobacteria bacterium]|nr:hypothetical protein [Pseudomonadota bacterium]